MADTIQLLPEAIANQIAAGEVIQRPASVVKELMENAIDAGSDSVQLILKQAGKSLIQVIDDGCGMTETDARLSFERHATSKIRNANDLYAIRTMGFRGEALASIAAVAQVEMKTRRRQDELGIRLQIEASDVKAQEPCQAAPGTSIAVKNLFYNLPARRNFLKTDTVETKHILDEFQRIAIANPDVHFRLHHNDNEVFHLAAGKLRQRLISIFGTRLQKNLVPVSEETDILQIRGYVGKPEFAKKTRGEQLFFVNNRFIKSGYLTHAVMSAYEELLPRDTYPLYVLFIDIDPERIDINVHPTKQEIKFDDERLVYNYLRVAVRHALGQHSIMPTLDFDQETSFNPTFGGSQSSVPSRSSNEPATPRSERSNIAFGGSQENRRERSNLERWESLYEGLGQDEANASSDEEEVLLTLESSFSAGEQDSTPETAARKAKPPYQIHQAFIVSQIKSGFILIDQQTAHERILYEEFLEALEQQRQSSQHQLFPRKIELHQQDAELLLSIKAEVSLLGFDLEHLGGGSFVINGLPAEMSGQTNEQELIERLLELFKQGAELKLDHRENIARSMARSAATRRGQELTVPEMQSLIDKLFACSIPYKGPTGRNCFLTFELDELLKQFDS